MHLPSIALAAALVLSACAGGGNTAIGSGHACPALVTSVPGSLVVPAKGATGVPVAPGTLTFTISSPDPSLFAGSSVALAYDVNALPIFTGPATLSGGVYSVAVPALRASTTYTATVGVSRTADGCTNSITSLLGSFTTQ